MCWSRSRWPTDAAHAAEMVEAAERADRVLMIDHTYCYTPAVAYIREAVASGTLGEILYVDSVRINLGLVQPDVDVFWDLAPHDLSILDFILPGGLGPDDDLSDRLRPAGRRQGLRRLPDAAAWPRAGSPTSPSTGCRPPRSGRW